MVPGADPVHRVTIVPRGQALGVTYQRPDTDRYNYPEAYLRARIVGMLGGRAAEEIVYGTKTTGAESDIEQATDLARRMVTRWGMSERLGMVQLAPRENPYLGGPSGFGGDKPFSEETAEAIDAEVRRIIGDSHDEAKRLLERSIASSSTRSPKPCWRARRSTSRRSWRSRGFRRHRRSKPACCRLPVKSPGIAAPQRVEAPPERPFDAMGIALRNDGADATAYRCARAAEPQRRPGACGTAPRGPAARW